GYVVEAGRIAVQTVAHEKVRRPVARIVIRRGITVLRFALEVHVSAEIEIQTAVAIVVGGRYAGEGALRRRLKAEGPWNRCEPPFAVIKEEHGLSGAHQH